MQNNLFEHMDLQSWFSKDLDDDRLFFYRFSNIWHPMILVFLEIHRGLREFLCVCEKMQQPLLGLDGYSSYGSTFTNVPTLVQQVVANDIGVSKYHVLSTI